MLYKTKHSKIRQNQRGIKDIYVEILEFFGEEKRVVGNAEKIFLPKKKIKKMIKALQKINGQELIVSDGVIVTVQHSR